MGKTRKQVKAADNQWYITDTITRLGNAGFLLDSGAYSAWSKGVEIDIDEYAQFLLEHQDYLSYFVNLDVIPPANARGDVEIRDADQACQKGWENYNYLIKKGVDRDKLVHVFHQGDDYKWLDYFVKEGVQYIGLSPRKRKKSIKEKLAWLDTCMRHVTDRKGFPVVKLHGFGVSSWRIMVMFPWYSVDTFAFVQRATLGYAEFPLIRNGEARYDVPPLTIAVTPDNKSAKHSLYDSHTPMHTNMFLEYLKSTQFPLGKSEYTEEDGERVEVVIEPGVINDHFIRCCFNSLYFIELAKRQPKYPWSYHSTVRGKTRSRRLL